MLKFMAIRLVRAVPVLLVVTVLTFSLRLFIPGDAAVILAGHEASPQQVQQIRHDLKLDQPFIDQLIAWYGHLLRGDLGTSLLVGQPVGEAFLERLPVTLSLTIVSMVLTIALAVIAGAIAAVRHNSWVDWTVMATALTGVSLPNFWIGLILIYIFSVKLGWFPTGGYRPLADGIGEWLKMLALPAVTLALMQIGLLARITRSSMLEVLRQDYVRTARANGISEGAIYTKHVLRNALIPIMTVIGLSFSLSMSGSAVVEQVFAMPGIGRLIVLAVLGRDYPVIQGVLLITAVMFVLINLFVDLVYVLIDPRVKYGA